MENSVEVRSSAMHTLMFMNDMNDDYVLSCGNIISDYILENIIELNENTRECARKSLALSKILCSGPKSKNVNTKTRESARHGSDLSKPLRSTGNPRKWREVYDMEENQDDDRLPGDFVCSSTST